jgi:hypothetical protein
VAAVCNDVLYIGIGGGGDVLCNCNGMAAVSVAATFADM